MLGAHSPSKTKFAAMASSAPSLLFVVLGLASGVTGVTGMKLGGNQTANAGKVLREDPELPECLGKLLEELVEEHDNFLCLTLSGKLGSAEEKACAESYEKFGDNHWQCKPQAKDETTFTCAAYSQCTEMVPVADGYVEANNYVSKITSPRGHLYFGSTGDTGGVCRGQNADLTPAFCIPKGGKDSLCKNDWCKGDLDGCMSVCDSIPSCRGIGQHYGSCGLHIDPLQIDSLLANPLIDHCRERHGTAAWPPVCSNRAGKWCGDGAPTNNCLIRRWTPATPPVPTGVKEDIQYAVVKESRDGFTYVGSTGDTGGLCVGKNGEFTFYCMAKGTFNGKCKSDGCGKDLEGCMAACDSIPSCRGFTQHYGGCGLHVDPLKQDQLKADGIVSGCGGRKTAWPPICLNRDNKYCGEGSPTHNCLIKKEGR
mmetsp:Transcript_16371/g.38767  ORF Transcript_16371/g.38767 Transcript_16371/m.38767 type:complete len:425 (-) Transcript_16371:68-1342(-)